MKHNKVLHRPMFNAQNSAYGRGITSNLVTEEQRQRFNDGGRVGLFKGSGLLTKIPGYDRLAKWGASKIPKQYNPAGWWNKIGGKVSQPGKGYFGSTKYGTKEVPLAKSLVK